MRRALGRNRKSVSVDNDVKGQKPEQMIKLGGAKGDIRRVLYLEEHNLVVAASQDGVVRVYDAGTSASASSSSGGAATDGKPRLEFKRHSGQVNGLVRLNHDLVATVGDDNQLFTWRPTTGVTLGEWKHEGGFLRSMAKMTDTRLIVGDNDGELVVLSHDNGREFKVEKRLDDAHTDWIRDIIVYRSMVLSCSSDKTAKLWDLKTLELVTTLSHTSGVYSGAMSKQRIITVCSNGKMAVHKNTSGYPFEFVLRTGDHLNFISSITILNDEIVAIASNSRSLGFVSLSDKMMIARTELNTNWVNSFTVLNDCRIAAGGTDGFCGIFSAPERVKDAVTDCVNVLYYSAAATSARLHPLRDAWVEIQKGVLSHTEACDNLFTEENCGRCMDEFCIAHNILMDGVENGEIAATTDYKETKAYWYYAVYDHCTELAMGEKDVEFLVSRFYEAEAAGIIVPGTAQILIGILAARTNIHAEDRYIVHAIHQLFLHKLKNDSRLSDTLDCANFDDILQLVNAIMDCVPKTEFIPQSVASDGGCIVENSKIYAFVHWLMENEQVSESDVSSLSTANCAGDGAQPNSGVSLDSMNVRGSGVIAKDGGGVGARSLIRPSMSCDNWTQPSRMIGESKIRSSVSRDNLRGVLQSLVMSWTNASTDLFKNEQLLIRFYRKSFTLLSDSNWDSIAVEKARNLISIVIHLGTSISDLRDEFDSLGNELASTISSVPTSGSKSTNDFMEELSSDAGIEPAQAIPEPESMSSQHSFASTPAPTSVPVQRRTRKCVSFTPPPPSPQSQELPIKRGSRDGNASEMQRWERLGFSKAVIEKLKTEEIASALAAFLVNFEPERSDNFTKLKHALTAQFYSAYIYGSSFTIATTDDEKRELMEVAMTALADAVGAGGKVPVSLRMRLRLFMRTASQ